MVNIHTPVNSFGTISMSSFPTLLRTCQGKMNKERIESIKLQQKLVGSSAKLA